MPPLAAYLNTFGSWQKTIDAYDDSLFPIQQVDVNLIDKYTLICEDEMEKIYLKYPNLSLAVIVEIFEIAYQLGVNAEAEAVEIEMLKNLYL